MAPVTLRYENRTAAVFGSVDEALAQAAHDRGFPGHLNPTYLVEGDQSLAHSTWTEENGLVHPDHEVKVLHGLEDIRDIRCDCLICDYHRQSQGKQNHGEKVAIFEHLFGEKYGHHIPPTLKPIAGGAVPGAGFVVNSTAVGLTAATAKSVIGLVAGSSVPPDMIEFSGGGDATSGNLLIEVIHGTNASAGTSTAFTPLQTRGQTQVATATAGITFTVEPTVLTVMRRWRYPWPGGPFLIQWPLGREPNGVVTAAASGKYYGFRATSTVTVTNSDWYVEIEE